MSITYKINHPINPEDFIDLLYRSNLSERRPVNDQACIKGMIENSNLVITAWNDNMLIGISRCMTDFHYACYLSDLAVCAEFKNQGVGKELQRVTQSQRGSKCKLILIAAPSANSYYEHIGFEQVDRCWLLKRQSNI